MNVFEQKHEEDVSGFTEVALWIHMLIQPSISRHALPLPALGCVTVSHGHHSLWAFAEAWGR